MALVVQKYGGTSVGSVERIQAVARRVARARQAGNGLVVVVSAMGHTTDELLKLAGQISANPPLREVDQLLATGEAQAMALVAMALHAIGVPAVSLTGPQAGIRTNGPHGKSRISGIRPGRALRSVENGQVVIVAGFQGLNSLDDVTTLGRGGSDTTAVALAAAVKAEICEIFTDVDGVYTADPRIVADARKLDRISYDDMAELAWRGAKVMHPRAIELGKLYGVDIVVRSSFNENPGTLITKVGSMEDVNTISGLAYDLDVAKITVAGAPSGTDTLARIFGALAEAEISVDVIVVETAGDARGRVDVSFTVAEKELRNALPIVEKVAAGLTAAGATAEGGLAKVSIVGTGMLNRPGYAARAFRTLAEAGVEVQMVTTSEIQVTCVIPRGRVEESVRQLHQAFGLGAFAGGQ